MTGEPRTLGQRVRLMAIRYGDLVKMVEAKGGYQPGIYSLREDTALLHEAADALQRRK